jgi:hypothetical protein
MPTLEEKNAMISARILTHVANGKSLPEAWDAVLGSVMTYEQFAMDLYHKLRNEKK